MGEDLPRDVALEAAQDLRLRLSFCGATADIVDSGLVAAHPSNDDPVEGGIGLAIGSAVQPVAAGLAAGGRQWAGARTFWRRLPPSGCAPDYRRQGSASQLLFPLRCRALC